MRRIFTVSIFGFLSTTRTLVVSVDISEPKIPTYDVPVPGFRSDAGWMTLNNNTRRSTYAAMAVRLNSISQRSLLGLITSIQHTESKPLNSVPSSTTNGQVKKGKVRHLKGSDSEEYIIFLQSYVPTLVNTKNRRYYRQPTSEEVVDWNNNLKIHSLRSIDLKKNVKKSNWKTSPFPQEARNVVNMHDWPIIISHHDEELYSDEWNTYGVNTGLPPVQWIREINRLHEFHKTPELIKDATKSRVPLVIFKAAFDSRACLVCRSHKYEKLFIGVQYCHKVNSQNRLVKEVVPFHNCGECAPQNECNQETIGIPKLTIDKADQAKTKKCGTTTKDGRENQPKDCETNRYTIFVQSYMPTIMITGQKKFRREATSYEVEDWNSNLKIHGLWPDHGKVESTLPFTPQARAAVDVKAWPMVRILDRELYVHEWETHGVHSGLGPLEYVQEINRLHEHHSTPDLFKHSNKHIPLDILKKAFKNKACLKCRDKDGEELLLSVYFCHRVNSETHKIEEQVEYEKCGACLTNTACKQETITLPKLIQLKKDNSPKSVQPKETTRNRYPKYDHQRKEDPTRNRRTFDGTTSKKAG